MSTESFEPATTGRASRFSLVVPVYGNEETIPDLLAEIDSIHRDLGGGLEAVFVVDGSPDRSAELLRERLPGCAFASTLVLLSRNFGSFAAIRAGLAESTGPYFAVMAADLQEPPDLVVRFFRALESDEVDVTIGTRIAREDPVFSRLGSSLFWAAYRRLVQPEMPAGGVDVFGCNEAVRSRLLGLNESNSTLVGLLFWLGFRRGFIAYERRARRHGRSGWTFGRKVRYLLDSVYAFSDLPIRILIAAGALGMVVSVVFGLIVLVARWQAAITVPGYSATVLVVMFFAALNMLGLGIVGSYVWRAFENTKERPSSVVASVDRFAGSRG